MDDLATPTDIRLWLVPITGFTQNLGQATGLERLWRSVRRSASRPRTCVVTPRTWDFDADAFARFVVRNSHRPLDRVAVGVYAYSWGAGSGFVRLAKALREHAPELTVDEAVLADPVYRSNWMPTWLPLNPLSLTGHPAIRVPANVRYVHHTFQRVDRPRAHKLRTTGPHTIIHPGVECEVGHTQMDDHPTYAELVERSVRRLTTREQRRQEQERA